MRLLLRRGSSLFLQRELEKTTRQIILSKHNEFHHFAALRQFPARRFCAAFIRSRHVNPWLLYTVNVTISITLSKTRREFTATPETGALVPKAL